ncbi:MAG: hypothetical protein ACJAUP_001200 [Cellvibrionaceae bacterium]|jgi:uncharacterized protein YheU (UPF0270 family)
MIIPPDELNKETLQGLMEEFITREGTDYGDKELDLETKVGILKQQLNSGKVVIIFDPATESVNVMTAVDYRQFSAPQYL